MSVSSPRLTARYRLIEQLGAGGMGRVWLARDEVLHRDVAIKEVALPSGLTAAEHEELRQLTLREAQAAARLSHPNVVGVYDVLLTDDRPWIVMEYLRARSLGQVLREEGPLPPQRVAKIGLALLAALRAAHAAGVVHRDVKPGNVLLADDGRVVLTDFGLAVFTSGEGSLTNPGLVRGSPQYMSPERAREGVSTPESDLWSLGATLYTAVEARSPYARGSVSATLTALATRPPDPAPQAGPLRPVLDGLLRKDPARRMNARSAEQALRRVAAGAPPGRVPRPRRPRLMAGVMLAILAIPGSVLVYQIRDAQGPPATVLPPLGSTAVGTAPDVGTGVGALACPPLTGPVPASERTHEYALVSGWVWYDDPSGFSVAVPAGWSYGGDGSTVCFGSPGGEAGGRVLAVGHLPPDGDDPVEFWTGQAEELVAAGRLPGYQPIAITERDYHRAAADWEFRYDADGTRRHAIVRGFRTAAGEAYAIHWTTPEFDWQVNRDYFDLVIASFTPRTIGG